MPRRALEVTSSSHRRVDHSHALLVPAPRLPAERFQLAANKETRQLPGYALVVAKGGHKSRPNLPPDAAPVAPDAAEPKPAELGSTLFIAVQEQLGLKLEAKKDSVDRAERPSENWSPI